MPEHNAVALDPILQYFTCEHLPEKLQVVSRPFCELALKIVDACPRNPERTVALRKLLESKDAAVRAALSLPERKRVDFNDPEPPPLVAPRRER